jgi:hypothetical protein
MVGYLRSRDLGMATTFTAPSGHATRRLDASLLRHYRYNNVREQRPGKLAEPIVNVLAVIRASAWWKWDTLAVASWPLRRVLVTRWALPRLCDNIASQMPHPMAVHGRPRIKTKLN